MTPAACASVFCLGFGLIIVAAFMTDVKLGLLASGLLLMLGAGKGARR